jgi:hypothetical protein
MGKLKRLALLIRYQFPSKLPVGVTEFDHFVSSIISVYKLPDFPSYRHAVAAAIMHLGPQETSKPKVFFAKSLKKSMANQVAFEMIQKIKDEEKKKAEETLLEQRAS